MKDTVVSFPTVPSISTLENHENEARSRFRLETRGPTLLDVARIVTYRQGIAVELVDSPPGFASGCVAGVLEVDGIMACGCINVKRTLVDRHTLFLDAERVTLKLKTMADDGDCLSTVLLRLHGGPFSLQRALPPTALIAISSADIPRLPTDLVTCAGRHGLVVRG
jgi:hypothetical protein